MKHEGPFKILIALLVLGGIAWALAAIFYEDPSREHPVESSENAEEMTMLPTTAPAVTDNQGGFYLTGRGDETLWYVRGEKYEPVTGLGEAIILDVVETTDGRIYVLADGGIWRLDGPVASKLRPGDPTAAEITGDPLAPDEEPPEPSISQTQPNLPPDPH